MVNSTFCFFLHLFDFKIMSFTRYPTAWTLNSEKSRSQSNIIIFFLSLLENIFTSKLMLLMPVPPYKNLDYSTTDVKMEGHNSTQKLQVFQWNSFWYNIYLDFRKRVHEPLERLSGSVRTSVRWFYYCSSQRLRNYLG